MLKGIPPVYYFSLDGSITSDHMKKSLSNLKVEKYEQVSLSKYTKDNVNEWKDLIIDRRNYSLPITTAAYAITVLEKLYDWYHNTDEDRLVLSRDTIDFGIIDYWDFTWETIEERMPYDWDCFLMGFENVNYIPFYLHQILPGHNFTIAMLNRRYVKKLLRLHYVDGKYRLVNKIANKNFGFKSGTVDYIIPHCGKTYCMPLFPNHTDFFPKKSKKYLLTKACRLSHYTWWRNQRKSRSLDELFTYGKVNDDGMIRKVPFTEWVKTLRDASN